MLNKSCLPSPRSPIRLSRSMYSWLKFDPSLNSLLSVGGKLGAERDHLSDELIE